MKKIFILICIVFAFIACGDFSASGTCGDNLKWKLTNGVLTISGFGDMTDWNYFSKAPWYSYQEMITGVTIGNSVTSIGDEAFQSCRYLTSITIPNSITSIGNNAFCGCSSLTSVTIPNSVTSIGERAFYKCTRLTSIEIPNSVASIGTATFNDCSGLTKIVVENGNNVYDSRDNCNAIIKTLTNALICGCNNTIIPNSVTSIGDEAFQSCRYLTSITIPNSVTSIGDKAFRDCSGLSSVTIGNSVTSIGNWAFTDCTSLTSITIPNSVTSIGNWAFGGCSRLKSITCKANVPPICGNLAFFEVSKSIPVYVPNKYVRTYKETKEWKEFNIVGLLAE